MAIPVRLRIVPGAEPNSYRFFVEFGAPDAAGDSLCAPARLNADDGQVLELGMLCAPTPETWREQRTLFLADYTYAQPGDHTAELVWGEIRVTAAVGAETPRTPRLPIVSLFDVRALPSRPLEVAVKLAVNSLMRPYRLRVDGGAGNVRGLAPDDTGPAQPEASWTFGYAKSGQYVIAADLLDEDGFWIATLTENRVEIAQPIADPETATARALVEVCPIPPPAGWEAAGTRSSSGLIVPASLETPWLLFRYARPQWAWARTYKQPGGSAISRSLRLGTYLAIRQETEVHGQLWYETGSFDWIPAGSLSFMTPSDLRGVGLNGATLPPLPLSPPPPRPPDKVRRGVVLANVLNVRSAPGITSPIVDQLRYNALVLSLEQREHGGAAWYRIGDNRWVHSAFIRLLDETPPGPQPPRLGMVNANALNVRARPGASASNPPVDVLRRSDHVTIYEETRVASVTWYRIGENRWVNGNFIRLLPAEILRSNELRGQLSPLAQTSEAQLPIGWVVTATVDVRSSPGSDQPVVGTATHNQSLIILETAAVGGVNWHRVGPDQWVYGPSVAVARLKARPSTIRSDERWVGVALKDQTAVAYEGDKPVFAAMVATGLPLTPTAQGIFRTWLRVVSRKMSGGSPNYGYYYLEEVPWTTYFYGATALHGAYWHDAFGRARSHGCVNLSLYDSWWFFRWSEPDGPRSPAVYVYWQ
jgi:lipoprotein-anchoring transpeptidase ErfK/SrfK